MTIEEFLTKFVEGYLFHDLKNMASLKPLPGFNDSAAGYPMIMSTLSGIELLGGLIDSRTYKTTPEAGKRYFSNYWKNYLVKINSNYNGLDRLFRNLIRNGLAHTYLAKPGILVVKNFNQSSIKSSIRFEVEEQKIIIDCIKFYKDLEDSYYKFIKPVVFKNKNSSKFSKTSMQQRLNKMIKSYTRQSIKEFKSFCSQEISFFLEGTPLSSGASLSASDINAQTTPISFTGFVDTSIPKNNDD